MQSCIIIGDWRNMKKNLKRIKKPEETYTFIDLFAGIGGFRTALIKNGGSCVFSSEWDKNSQKTYFDNYNEKPKGDITKINAAEIPKHDVLCAGFPCQAFSVSGKRLGFDDTRGTLFREIARIAKHHQPKVLFLENVKNLLRHDNGNTIKVILNTLEEIGYTPFVKMLRSSDFNVPQARERIYIVCFRNDLGITEFNYPEPVNETKVVKDILEKEPVDTSFYIERDDIDMYGIDKKIADPRRPSQVGKINKGGQGERIYSIDAAGATLSAYGGGAAAKTGAYLIAGKVRKLTPRECARMQGYTDDFILPDKKNIAYKQFGDSVSVPVLEAVMERILVSCPSLCSTSVKNKNSKKDTISKLSLENNYAK